MDVEKSKDCFSHWRFHLHFTLWASRGGAQPPSATEAVLRAAVAWSVRYLPDFRLPDKPLDLVAQAGATVRLRALTLEVEELPGGVTPLARHAASRGCHLDESDAGSADRGCIVERENHSETGVTGDARRRFIVSPCVGDFVMPPNKCHI